MTLIPDRGPDAPDPAVPSRRRDSGRRNTPIEEPPSDSIGKPGEIDDPPVDDGDADADRGIDDPDPDEV